jgi:hypothetical protein
MNNTHTFTISLVVKGASVEDATNAIRARLADWYHDPDQQHIVIGYGYPNGSLMYWHVEPKTE